MPLAEGQIIGNHVLLRKLGGGAFGEVWLVRHVELNDERAMKIPTDPDYVKQLRMEGKVQFSLRHPNIVQTLDLNTSHDPPYFLMEYVAGSDLRKKLRTQGKLPIQEGVPILMQILEALAAAHSDGVLHRDLKPENILITPKGQVKVADFGLGKVQTAVARSLLVSGSLMSKEGNSISGTVEYMSPEQKEGADPDARDDLYAAGIIACELLTGQRPIPAGIAKMLQRADVDQRFVPVIEKALEFERAERYRSAVEMLEGLADLGVMRQGRAPAVAGPVPPPPPRSSTVQSRPAAAPTSSGPFTNSIGMQFVTIQAGEFLMGEGSSAKRTRIARGFGLATTVVTQGQWRTVMGTEPWKGQSWVEDGDDYPATYVSWDDAVAFCEKLSAKENKKYRLPTESEWEYACRARSTTAYCFGDDESELGDRAWYDKNCSTVDESYAHQVAQKKPNAWGLFDMHGNVWEWCIDWYDQTKASRVLRGGAWRCDPQYCRAAYRVINSPGGRSDGFGFRCALDFS